MIEINKLTIDEYYKLLDSVNWKRPSERLLKISLKKGINVKYVLNKETVGMARFVTDGGYAGLIMDVIVLPEYQGKGVGRKIIEMLEKDEYYLRAKRIEIPASITAVEFYRKMGYDYKNGNTELENGLMYRLEKFR